MEQTMFTPYSAALGGVLIGLGAVLLMASLGRIAGISGIIGSLLGKTQANSGEARGWRWAFLLGLLGAATLAHYSLGWSPVPRQGFSVPLLVIGGLLVGFGTALGHGCTSGHGVCGLSRLSPRSLAATVAFMVSGVVTATVIYGWLAP